MGRGVGGRRTPTVIVRAASRADRRLSSPACAVGARLCLISASKAEQAAFSPAAGQSWQLRPGRRWHHIRLRPRVPRAGVLGPCGQSQVRICHTSSSLSCQGVLFASNVLSNHGDASCHPFSSSSNTTRLQQAIKTPHQSCQSCPGAWTGPTRLEKPERDPTNLGGSPLKHQGWGNQHCARQPRAPSALPSLLSPKLQAARCLPAAGCVLLLPHEIGEGEPERTRGQEQILKDVSTQSFKKKKKGSRRNDFACLNHRAGLQKQEARL